MRYVVAGYIVILTVLALYAVQLVWRRHRLERAVARVVAPGGAPDRSAAGAPTDGSPS